MKSIILSIAILALLFSCTKKEGQLNVECSKGEYEVKIRTDSSNISNVRMAQIAIDKLTPIVKKFEDQSKYEQREGDFCRITPGDYFDLTVSAFIHEINILKLEVEGFNTFYENSEVYFGRIKQ